jgi:N-acyl-D-amino-acid deacylase
MDLDVLITGAQIIDGTGSRARPGSLAIRDGRIVTLSADRSACARRTIDAGGLVAAPGFIDVHTHSDLMLLAEPHAPAKIMQGVTTEVIGQDGLSYAPGTESTLAHFRTALRALNGDPEGLPWDWRGLGEFLDRFDQRTAVNVAMLAPHGNLRAMVLGMENRPATDAELAQIERLLDQAMQEGALGLSTGLTYAPCSFADTRELVGLCRVVARHGGYFAPHLRNYGPEMEAAVDEVLQVAAAAGVPLHLTHFQASFPSGVGKAGLYLERIARARLQGLEITLDAYPYLAGSTFLAGLLPSWTHEGGPEKLLARLADPGTRETIRREMEVTGSDGFQKVPAQWDIVVVSDVAGRENAAMVGKTLEQVARLRGRPPFECFADLLVEEKLAVSCITFIGHEENLQQFIEDPMFMAASDGLLIGARPHPRAWGTFARYLGRYVRQLRILSLEECVRKMTGLPAWRLGLGDRGTLAPGQAADLVLFDPRSVRDTATYDHPRSHPEGIPYVLVNGTVVKDDGHPTGALPGRSLRPRRGA